MMLTVENIDSYYAHSRVLRKVSLEIRPGEIVALLGRNGVGKSTTLKSIMGAVPPKTGSIRFNGKELRGLPPHAIARAGLGYVPEERRIFPSLTVRENLLMGVRAGDPGRAETKWPISEVYERFPHLARRDRIAAGHLSGGEKQLLSIARTLMGNPTLMLVDEPSEGLSPLIVQDIFALLRELNQQGMTILLVDQNLSFSCALAERIYIMQKGQVVYQATGEEVINDEQCQARFLAV